MLIRSPSFALSPLLLGAALLPGQSPSLERIDLETPGADPSGRVAAAVGDVDADGIEDLVVGLNGRMAWRRGIAGAPERRFAALAPLPGAGDAPSPKVTASCEHAGQPHLVDVDGDGVLDLVVADGTSLSTDLGLLGERIDRIVWFRGRAEGFGPRRFLEVQGKPWRSEVQLAGIQPADWDGDGDLDYLLEFDSGYPRRLGVLDPATGVVTDFEDVRGHSPLAIDWDGDGRVDLLTIHDGHVQLRLRGAVGDELGAPRQLGEIRSTDLAAWISAVDWDGDGKLDLMLGEMIYREVEPSVAPLTDVEKRRLDAARRIVDFVEAEQQSLNESRPPLGDASAMKARRQLREELARWAAEPRAVVRTLDEQASDALVRRLPQPQLAVLRRL